MLNYDLCIKRDFALGWCLLNFSIISRSNFLNKITFFLSVLLDIGKFMCSQSVVTSIFVICQKLLLFRIQNSDLHISLDEKYRRLNIWDITVQ